MWGSLGRRQMRIAYETIEGGASVAGAGSGQGICPHTTSDHLENGAASGGAPPSSERIPGPTVSFKAGPAP